MNRWRGWSPHLEVLEDRDLPSLTAHPTYVLLNQSGGVNPFLGFGPTGTTPSQILHAYGFDQIKFNNGTVPGDGTGETIAIVDAYDDPNAASDLHQFDVQFNLPDPTFTKVNQAGGTKLPQPDTGWAVEIALDIEWAHAIAPKAKILLVEATDANVNNLVAGVAFAASQPGVVAVSSSWGAGEFAGENSYDSSFLTPTGHPGVTFFVSSGDSGAPATYPSVSPNVVAVGGTTLQMDAQGNILSESGWSGSGGGVSALEPQPSYQNGVVTQSATARTAPDVAYNADPNSGYPIYDSYNQPGWQEIGGTSAAAPQWAALIAIADQGRALAGQSSLNGLTQTLPLLYSLPATDFHDITTGGSTGTPPFNCGPGYDLVTGRGSPLANLIVNACTLPSTDMALTAAGPATVTAGTNATYTLTITDNGPSAAQGVVLNDVLPTGSTFVSLTQTAGTDSFTLGQSGGSATETATGNIASGSSDTFTLVVFAPANLKSGATFNDTATVGAGNPDPNLANNSATITGSIFVIPPTQLQDPGFETPSLGSGTSAYQYDPAASPWTWLGQAGVSGNGSGFTSGNPNAPQGSQVAFLETTGSFSQAVTLTAGSYVVTFSAAQRAIYQSSSQTFQVQIDGAVVGTFTPASTFYANFTTTVFTLAAGVHTVGFVGLNPNGGDNTAFIDQVALTGPPPPPPTQLQDPGFETPSLGSGASAYLYDPATSPWTWVGQAGVSGNGSGFTSGNPNAPQGSQVAFLEMTGSFSQAVTLSAGSYVVTFSAAQRAAHQSGSQTFQVQIDGAVVGTFTPTSTSYANFTTTVFTLAAGVHTVGFVGLNPNGGDNTAFIDQVALIVPPPPPPPPTQLQDPGFETPSLGSGTSAYLYDPTASPWTWVGQAGVSGNGSGFTSGNPNAPQGSQVAFLQTTGSFNQAVAPTAGSYVVTFSAAQRATHQSSSQTFQVQIDGAVVGTFTPAGTSYANFTTTVFTLAAGVHTVGFVGLNPNGGDNTAFIDQVALIVPPPPPPPPTQLQDPGFETPSVGSGTSAYLYDPAASPWTWVGQAGVSGNGSGFTSGNPNAPQGSQVAFLQTTGSFSQAVTLTAGSYVVTFSAAQRAAHQSGTQTFQVQIDGAVVGTFTPASTSYANFTTTVFTLSAGVHTVAFVGINPNGGDNTAFIDQVALTAPPPPPPPPPTQLQDPGFETPSLGSGTSAYQYDPTASPWTWVGQAGVSGNGSGFTSGNPNAPQGSQVAFLERTGSFSQAVTLTAGSYVITFSAAQRATYQSSSQTFQVQLDGAVVGTFTPASTSYANFTTTVFTLSAGVHTVAFVGLNPNGGDNTAFIDQVALTGPPPPPPTQLQDPGFETPSVGSGTSAYLYDPATSPWIWVGQAGVSGNGSGFTSGNPNAPEGSQVAFLQTTGSFSQAVTLTAGSYVVTFSAAQRAAHQSGTQTFQVQIDGAAVGTFTPASTSYANFTTTVFTLSAGGHTVAFVGINPNGGDNTAFVDQVALTPQSPPSISYPPHGRKLPVMGESHAHRSEPMGQAADSVFWMLYGKRASEV